MNLKANTYEAPGCQETKDTPERIFSFFPLCLVLATSASGTVSRLDFSIEMQSKRACTKHLLRFYRPQDGDCTALGMALCDLETYRCPHAVLVKEGAEP